MTETPKQIGAYPIEREIGRGGMGIVYLARDVKLDRQVAIKVLPDLLASDPERLARFEREARLLASLNHPNIAGIYGLEEADGQRFLALEYVEGETLSARIGRGPLSVDDAVDVCRQIAAALETAHDNGVIHRDLKPGNVMLTPGGEVKVLDFGLAKGAGSSTASDPNLSQSPTIALTAATSAGMILGTAAYMSPEQARGKAVDRRTDIWSFGCVLYECLTGRQAFAGETVSDIVALILQGAPNWDALPADVPPQVRDLLERCFEKDAKKRLRDIGEARLLLAGDVSASMSGIRADTIVTPQQRARAAWPGYALAAVFALSTVVLGWRLLSNSNDATPMRLVIPDPPGARRFGEPVLSSLSPDGKSLAFVAADSTGETSIWLRELGATDARQIPGTEDGLLPFWSPDNRYIGFTTQERLKKVEVRGGNPETLGPLRSYGRGATWNAAGQIVFCAAGEGPLFVISENGGKAEQLTRLDSTETAHRFPHFLPDGKHFLFASLPPKEDLCEIYIGSVDGAEPERLMSASGVPQYVEPGFLMYVRNGRIVAHPFDAGSRKLGGDPTTLPDEPGDTEWVGFCGITAARSGPLSYIRRPDLSTDIVWLDAGRRSERVPVPAANYEAISLSPDGKRAAVVKSASSTESDLWIIELERGTMSRFTFGPARVDAPVWSPDGTRIAFSSNRADRWDVYMKSLGSSSAAEPVFVGGSGLKFTSDWSPDGRYIVFNALDRDTGWDVWVVPVDGDRTPIAYAMNPFDQSNGRFSPDGRWVAYDSFESGRAEVYVQSFPTPGPKFQVSSAGGSAPSWRSDGRQIVHQTTSRDIVMVDVASDGGFRVGSSHTVSVSEQWRSASILRDFSRALVVVPTADSNASGAIMIALNWRADLTRD